MSRKRFRVNPHYIDLNVKEVFTWNRWDTWSLSDCNGTRMHKHLVSKRLLNHLTKRTKWLSWIVSTYLYGAFDCMFLLCHAGVSKWIDSLYWHKCAELLARNRRDSWSLSHWNRTQTHNHLVSKGTLNHFAKLTKQLRWVVSTDLYGAFECLFILCHVRLSE